MEDLNKIINDTKRWLRGEKVEWEPTPVPERRHIAKWVKMPVSFREWNNWYSSQEHYVLLEKKENSVVVGFLVADEVPRGCEEIISYDDLWKINEWYKQYNISPRPFND